MNPNENSMAPDWRDPDEAPDLSQPEWAERLAEIPVKRGRPHKEARKISTTIRLDADVMEAFRAGGEGWQSRINAALREWLARETERTR